MSVHLRLKYIPHSKQLELSRAVINCKYCQRSLSYGSYYKHLISSCKVSPKGDRYALSRIHAQVAKELKEKMQFVKTPKYWCRTCAKYIVDDGVQTQIITGKSGNTYMQCYSCHSRLKKKSYAWRYRLDISNSDNSDSQKSNRQ